MNKPARRPPVKKPWPSRRPPSAAEALRRAVLPPLFGMSALDDLTGSERKVRDLWTARVEALRVLGAPGFTGRIDSLKNCRPAFSLIAYPQQLPSAQSCRNAICPFCWGRRAFHLAGRLLETLQGTPGPAPAASVRALILGGELVRPRPTPGARLLLRRASLPEAGCPTRGDARPLAAALRRRADGCDWPAHPVPGWRYGRREEFARWRAAGAVGSVDLVRVVPRDARWALEFRQLAAVPVAWVEPSESLGRWLREPELGAELLDWGVAEPGDVVRAVAWLLAYPAFLLKGDPKPVKEFLEARQGRHLYQTGGRLRGAAPRRGPP